MIIIHGDNQVVSRQFLLDAKQAAVKKDLEIISLDGSELTLGDLHQYVNSSNLLGKTNCVIVEGFFSRRPSNEKKKITDQLVNWLADELIFWDGKDLGVQLKTFPSEVIKKFELPRTVFRFLDTLSLADLTSTLENTPAEFIFSLLAGHVRKLIMVKQDALVVPTWQLGKLKSQVSKYTLEKLIKMHANLLTLDYKNKTSATAMDLAAGLELWVFSNHNGS